MNFKGCLIHLLERQAGGDRLQDALLIKRHRDRRQADAGDLVAVGVDGHDARAVEIVEAGRRVDPINGSADAVGTGNQSRASSAGIATLPASTAVPTSSGSPVHRPTAQLLDWCKMSGREDGIYTYYRMRYEEMMRKKQGLPSACRARPGAWPPIRKLSSSLNVPRHAS